jgi:glycopeptide antibiotics resistance protein
MVTFMLKLLLGVLVELFIAVSLAGAMLALLIPALSLSQAVGKGDVRVIVGVLGVLLASVAVALFRPGSAIHRYIKR